MTTVPEPVDDTTPRRAELFVRSLAPDTARARQEQVLERLRELEAAGVVEGVTVHLAGDCVCPESVAADTETGSFLLSRVEQFEQWAATNDVALEGFERRCVDSSLTGETVTGIRFPRLCLAVFDDDGLVFVAPSESTGVPDALDWLAAEVDA